MDPPRAAGFLAGHGAAAGRAAREGYFTSTLPFMPGCSPQMYS